jgi:tetratricopeptide (TPR) repeat protein
VTKRYGLFAAVVLAFCARAQGPQIATVTGTLHSDTEIVLQGFVAELDTLSPLGATERVDVSSTGDFSFHNIPFGDYTLRITTYYGDEISQQFVSVHERATPLDVRLPSHAPEPSGATVSMAELRHPPARKAVQALVAAQRFSESGRVDKAAGELEKAVRLSPDFAQARSNLGVQYLRMQRFADAREEIQRAIEIGGPNPRDLANLAFTFVQLSRLPEAADAARKALDIDRNCAPAHYILGSILAVNPGTRAAGIAHLEFAARTMDSARRALEHLGH